MRPMCHLSPVFILLLFLSLPEVGTAGICDPGPPCVDATDIINGQVTPQELSPQIVNLIVGLKNDVEELQAEVATLQSELAAVQANSVLDLNGILSLTGDAALFEGVNLQVVNGTGTTDGEPNGVGNLIIGYDATDVADGPICSLGDFSNQVNCEANGGVWASSHKSGSHNVVIGDEHNYSRFGGLVVGLNNNVTGDWSNVSGGGGHSASGFASSVSGGVGNTASSSWASVTGGQENIASGFASSISAGGGNTASGSRASVGGGELNVASGFDSSVSGGGENTASGVASSVSGGQGNIASGQYALVVGGGDVLYPNEAFADHSVILGGIGNLTGDVNKVDRTIGSEATITAGTNNIASGFASSVSGGSLNIASGAVSSVSAGNSNEAIGDFSSVSGGFDNTASGIEASVSGGTFNTASGTFSSVSGGRANTAGGGESSSVSGGLARSVSESYNWRAGSLFETQ